VLIPKVREEDVLGVCTTRYKYSQKAGVTQVTKNKDLSTCSRDKLHFSSSPVLTSLLGPLVSMMNASERKGNVWVRCLGGRSFLS
jgi:hypothetical protein